MYLPGDPIGNDALAKLFGRRVRRICEAIGVRTRYWAVDPSNGWVRTELRNSEMAVHAARAALINAQRLPAEIDVIILVTATPDFPFPATVTFVQESLGISECIALELRAACAGVPQALALADLLLRSGQASAALVIGSELSSSLVNLARVDGYGDAVSDDFILSAVMFGDGAGAVVLSAKETDLERRGIFAAVMNSVGLGRAPGFLCRIGGSVQPFVTRDDRSDTYLSHDIRAIAEMGPRLVLRAFEDLTARTGIGYDEFQRIIPPQANPNLTRKTMAIRGVSGDRVFFNVDRVGNTSSASLLIALDEANRLGHLVLGDHVAILGAEASKWLYSGIALTWTKEN